MVRSHEREERLSKTRFEAHRLSRFLRAARLISRVRDQPVEKLRALKTLDDTEQQGHVCRRARFFRFQSNQFIHSPACLSTRYEAIDKNVPRHLRIYTNSDFDPADTSFLRETVDDSFVFGSTLNNRMTFVSTVFHSKWAEKVSSVN